MTEYMCEFRVDVDDSSGGLLVSSDVNDLTTHEGGQFNDKISRVRIPPHAKVVLYEHINFAGTYLAINNGMDNEWVDIDLTISIAKIGSDPPNGYLNFNDRTSSIKIQYDADYAGFSSLEIPTSIYKDPSNLAEIEFFSDYNGAGKSYPENSSNWHIMTQDANRTSSIGVRPNMHMNFEVFTDKNYSGKSHVFPYNLSENIYKIYNLDGNISFLNDNTSSLKIGV